METLSSNMNTLVKNRMIILLIVLMLSCNSSRKPDSTGLMQNAEYCIVYNVLLDNNTDNYEVFTMNLDGSNKINITNLPGVEWSYISFKEAVFFISDKDTCHRCYFLYETNHSGNKPIKISHFRLADSWMSTRNIGSEIIVKPHHSVDSAFLIIDRKGAILNRIETGLPYSSDPLFVNDGKQIVFRGGKTKSKLIDGFSEELYIIDADGKNRMQLTHYPENDTTAGKFGYHAGPPKLNPQENFISYQSKQNNKYSLYGVSLDGKKQWKLTENDFNEGWHDWSPDGKWLAVELFDDDQTQFHIGLMNWQTREFKILTDSTFKYQQCPNFVLKNGKPGKL